MARRKKDEAGTGDPGRPEWTIAEVMHGHTVILESIRSDFRLFGDALQALDTRLTNEIRRTREDLSAGQVVLELAVRENTARISGLEVDVRGLKTDVAELKADVAVLKADVAVLKTDVAELKADVAALKTDVAVLKTDVAELKADMVEVKGHLVVVDSRLDGLDASVRQNTAAIRTLVEQFDVLASHEPRIAALERRCAG